MLAATHNNRQELFVETRLFENLVKPISYEEPLSKEWQMRRNFLSGKFTSRWDEIPIVNRIEI